MTTKERAMSHIALIASNKGHLIAYRDLEAMYAAVVYHRRWWRRLFVALKS